MDGKSDVTAPVHIHVCEDSQEAMKQKIALIQKAQNSVVISGCYLGGAAFTDTLHAIEKKIQEHPEFQAYILGSEIMLEEENRIFLDHLSTTYPNQFNAVITPEIVPYKNPQTGDFFLATNHVKALVIDGGEAFLIGGSGIEDRWATQTGLKKPIHMGFRPIQPLSFRDIDYVFDGAKSVGKRLHFELLSLFSHCRHARKEEFFERYFDPRYYLTDSFLKTSKHALHSGKQTRLELITTGPMDQENAFQKRLIELINKGKERIVINHMYFHPSEALLQALIDASNRGVNIILVTNKNDERMPGTHNLFAARSRLQWKRLYEGRWKGNISIYEYDVPYTTYHKKVVIIDQILATGSSNIGRKSLESLDFEYNLIIHSEEAVEETLKRTTMDMLHSRRVNPNEVNLSIDELVAGIGQFPLEFFL
jgi:phosphatidylserine/phosphatidylglycerophosphate/cardiolipin synthase-like enzyme